MNEVKKKKNRKKKEKNRSKKKSKRTFFFLSFSSPNKDITSCALKSERQSSGLATTGNPGSLKHADEVVRKCESLLLRRGPR